MNLNIKMVNLKFGTIIAAALCMLCVTGCAVYNFSYKAERTLFAMDTVMTIKAYGKNADTALKLAEEEIHKLDKALDRGAEGSEIYKLNSNAVSKVSEETAELIAGALSVCASTDGALDISVAPVMDLWGFYKDEFRVPSGDELAAALDKVDYNNVTVDGDVVTVQNGAQLDLGGVAKGYLSSKIMEIMRESGVSSGIVSLGGNVQTLGNKPDGSKWRVAIQDPDSEGKYAGIVELSDMAVITSGGYQRFFEQDGTVYHHIIDLSTGYPADSGLKSVSIISADGTLADGLSTALFVMGLDRAVEYWRTREDFDVVFITDDNSMLITEGIEDMFESEREFSVINH